MSSLNLYLAAAIAVLVVALWLAFQVIAFALKALLLAAIVLVGVAAFRAWRAASPS